MGNYRHPNRQPSLVDQDTTYRRGRRAVIAGVGAAVTGTIAVVSGVIPNVAGADSPKPDVPMGEYRIQPGDRAWTVGEKVEANHDGIQGNEDVRPYSDDVARQIGKTADIGEPVQVPESADINPNVPGVQL